MITVYGIPNCDVIKKAVSWLQAGKINYQFHDYKKEGISPEKLRSWCKQAGYETIFNKRSTTWKELSPKEQAAVTNETAAINIMTAHTSIIKRPVIEKDGKLVAVGFDEKKYQQLFGK
jgi:arsenate reductase